MKKNFYFYRMILHVVILSICCLFGYDASAEEVRLTVVSMEDKSHAYYHELLESLAATGNKLNLTYIPDVPQVRISKMLESGDISIHWFIHTAERDQKYFPVRTDLTKGLVGYRIFFIPQGDQGFYENIKNIDNFKKLNKLGAFGKGWFDCEVWKKNGLKYIEIEGEWRNIYKMLDAKNRGIDYFSRGLTEILDEAELHPYLHIEDRLTFHYERDFRFYLSKPAEKYRDMIESSLNKARKSGLMDKIIEKHFGGTLKKLNFKRRIKINLDTPE